MRIGMAKFYAFLLVIHVGMLGVLWLVGRSSRRIHAREQLFYITVFAGSLLVAGLVPVPSQWRSILIQIAVTAAVAVVAVALVISIRGIRRTHAIRRRVVGNWGRVCPECGYDLSRLPEEGVCPECGAPFTTELLAEIWKPWLQCS